MALTIRTTALLLAALLGLSQCKKKDPDPVDQLPPATQTGANSFGCLVNGQPWTPQGLFFGKPYSLVYDFRAPGGHLHLRADRFSTQLPQSIDLVASHVNRPGAYPLDAGTAYDSGITGPCQQYTAFRPGFRVRGLLVITRLDPGPGIVSGTFAFTLYQPGCDSVKVTQGRFDKKR